MTAGCCRVRICAYDGPSWGAATRTVEWVGFVGWPGAPQRGDTWLCCGDWSGETLGRVIFCHPTSEDIAMSIEIPTTGETLDHLIECHEFVGWTSRKARR